MEQVPIPVLWVLVAAVCAFTVLCLLLEPPWVSSIIVGAESAAWCWWLEREANRHVETL
jgi:hypothetical protein